MKKMTISAVGSLIFLLVFFASCKKSTTTPVNTMYNISATLTGAQEVPAVTTSGTGTVTGTFDASTNLLTYNVTWSGLSGAATAAHFHGPAAAGYNGSVVLPFTINANGVSANGSATLTDAQKSDLLAGNWYANVHTTAHPGGEIRGQVSATH